MFRNLFTGKKRNGSQLLNEGLERVIVLGTALNSFPEIVRHMQRTSREFADGAEEIMMAQCFLPFGEQAVRDGEFAKRILADLRREAVDISSMAEEEFVMLLAATNYLLTAGSLADEIASEPEQMVAVRSLYCNPSDPRRDTADDIVTFANIAQSVKTARLMPTSDYLERLKALCFEIPEQVHEGGIKAFASLKAKKR